MGILKDILEMTKKSGSSMVTPVVPTSVNHTNSSIEDTGKNSTSVISKIRSIAHRYGYAEVQFNEKSCVIGFKRMDGNVRINVYYTTGTIASCLSHPLKGKTQLFRRNQSLDDMELIFKNPRIHTGDGYYTVKDHCDDELRWRYVAAAAAAVATDNNTHNFCNERQVSQIAAICRLWDEIRFNKNGPTTMEVYDSQPDEIKSQWKSSPCPEGCGLCGHERAGTFCVLGSILLNVARITEGADVQINTMFPSVERITDKRFSKSDGTLDPILCDDVFLQCECEHGQMIRHFLSDTLQRFERQLMSFPKRIRRELIYFFFKKIMHGNELMLSTKESLGDASWFTTEIMGEQFYLTSYGGHYLSNKVLSAHYDYGVLTYGDDDTTGRTYCYCHGVNV